MYKYFVQFLCQSTCDHKVRILKINHLSNLIVNTIQLRRRETKKVLNVENNITCYQCDIVHGQVVGLKKFSKVDEGEEEEQHERGDEEPAVDQPVALELVSLKE